MKKKSTNKLIFAGYTFSNYQAKSVKDMVAINYRRTKRMLNFNNYTKTATYKVYIQKVS